MVTRRYTKQGEEFSLKENTTAFKNKGPQHSLTNILDSFEYSFEKKCCVHSNLKYSQHVYTPPIFLKLFDFEPPQQEYTLNVNLIKSNDRIQGHR